MILGCAMPEAEQGMNVARIACLLAGVPISAAAMTVNRFCALGPAGHRARWRSGGRRRADVVIAGGTESMTLDSDGRSQGRPSIRGWATGTRCLPLMGLTAERVREAYGVDARGATVRAGDHQKAVAATPPARSTHEIVPVPVTFTTPTAKTKIASRWTKARAATPRSRRSAKLKPAFHAKGTVTAGNSSQTSDGAAAAVVMSAARAKALGHRSRSRVSSRSPTPASCPRAWASARSHGRFRRP